MSVKLVSDLSFLEGIKEFPICHSLLLDAYGVTLLGLNHLMLNVDSKSKAKQNPSIDSDQYPATSSRILIWYYF